MLSDLMYHVGVLHSLINLTTHDRMFTLAQTSYNQNGRTSFSPKRWRDARKFFLLLSSLCPVESVVIGVQRYRLLCIGFTVTKTISKARHLTVQTEQSRAKNSHVELRKSC